VRVAVLVQNFSFFLVKHNIYYIYIKMEPSAFDKMKMGAAMGGTVGLCIGFVFGTISLIR
jgi:hypothetical protein